MRDCSYTLLQAGAPHFWHGLTPEEPQDTTKDTHMNIARKIGLTVAATLVSFSLVGISAPAHADTSWGWRTPVSSR